MGHKKKLKNIVYFEDEVIKKEEADSLLNRLKETKKQYENETGISKIERKKKKTRKQQVEIENESETVNKQNEIHQDCKTEQVKKKRKHQDESSDSKTNVEENTIKKEKSKKSKKIPENNEEGSPPKKSKKRKQEEEDKDHADNNTIEEDSSNKEEGTDSAKKPKSESKRSLKRKKHAQLLEEKKMKGELKMQQSVLNYLSKWKHARCEWKFEKLKQIWLQQNLFVIDKLPEEFWSTIVEYLNGSKGATRKIILKEALKIIEKEDKAEGENDDNNYQTTLRRARDVVQTLEE